MWALVEKTSTINHFSRSPTISDLRLLKHDQRGQAQIDFLTNPPSILRTNTTFYSSLHSMTAVRSSKFSLNLYPALTSYYVQKIFFVFFDFQCTLGVLICVVALLS